VNSALQQPGAVVETAAYAAAAEGVHTFPLSSAKVKGLSTYLPSLVDNGWMAGGVTMMARRSKVIT
jgi:hypothetical protein